MKDFALGWGTLVLSVAFNAFGVFVVKWRLNELGTLPLNSFKDALGYSWLLLKSPLVVPGLVLFLVAPFLFAVALSRMEISVAYPAQLGLNLVVLLLFGCFLLREQMTLFKIIGILCVLLGVYFMNKQS
jgi:multidrug transporter EmrE-like cation transporter